MKLYILCIVLMFASCFAVMLDMLTASSILFALTIAVYSVASYRSEREAKHKQAVRSRYI